MPTLQQRMLRTSCSSESYASDTLRRSSFRSHRDVMLGPCRAFPSVSFDQTCAPHLPLQLWPAQCCCRRISSPRRSDRHQQRRRASRSAAAAAGGPSDVFVLDLDGVIVDSEPEASVMHASPIACSLCYARVMHASLVACSLRCAQIHSTIS